MGVNRAPYIVGPLYDGLFFILSPMLAVALGWFLQGAANAPPDDPRRLVHSVAYTPFIYAHLFLVFVRSHGNGAIFKLYPWRFTLVPLALFGAILASPGVLVVASVLSIWWDVYHSSLQTFGLGRIYDRNAGNDVHAGRRLDWLLNLLIYAGPILAGAALMGHVNSFHNFSKVGAAFFTEVPAYAESHARVLTWAVVAVAGLFLPLYVALYVRLHRRGYRVSFPKVALLVSTAIASVFAWGFNSFGEGFFIANFFHALQYFALVWWSENRNLARAFRLDGAPGGRALTLLLFLALAWGYGLWAARYGDAAPAAYAFTLVVALMHFWYDGFIWSVRKSQV